MEDINRLKLLLVEKKKTSKWLSEQLGITPSTVSKWCTNTSQPVRRVGDFAARRRKFQRGVEQIPRRGLRGQFDGCLKIVCHNCLTLPFCYNAVLGIDLFDVCHDVGENRHDDAVSRQLVEFCVAQMKLVPELEELEVLKAHQPEAFLRSRLTFRIPFLLRPVLRRFPPLHRRSGILLPIPPA